jgi:hypothetical protein
VVCASWLRPSAQLLAACGGVEGFCAPAPAAAGGGAAVLYVLLGLDLAADAAGRLWLLEVNTHPALASGTMSAAPQEVYDRLAADLLLPLGLADEGCEGGGEGDDAEGCGFREV